MITRRGLTTIAQWVALGAVVGVGCGLASAAFLFLLEHATEWRVHHGWIVWSLPLAGLVIGAAYARWGEPIKGGNNLVIDSVHEDRPQIPLRMAPMVLVGTVLTHLFGGSAGREGTAVQMGGSIADAIAHRLRVSRELRTQMLAAGIAGGFGSVFGTPIAGTVFGLEVVVIGRLEYHALLPAMVASVVGDLVVRALGIAHTVYPTPPPMALSPKLLAIWLGFGIAMAIAAIVFIELTHGLKKVLEERVPSLPLRMALGGLAVVLMWRAVGTDDYLGLGVPTIVRAFEDPSLVPWAFAAKLVFTAVTLSAGFLGGEVTPLFFVGATLGSVLARATGVPIALGAAVGLAAVFGAAANTPLALSIMAVELLGANVLPHVAIVTVIAYLLTGHRGIYPAQRVFRRKHGPALASLARLSDLRAPERPPNGTMERERHP